MKLLTQTQAEEDAKIGAERGRGQKSAGDTTDAFGLTPPLHSTLEQKKGQSFLPDPKAKAPSWRSKAPPPPRSAELKPNLSSLLGPARAVAIGGRPHVEPEKKSKRTGARKCIHGKRKYYCKDCGGSQICDHGKQRNSCKECKGSQICPHGKRKQTCKECDGCAICVHGKEKYRCKQCGGSGIW